MDADLLIDGPLMTVKSYLPIHKLESVEDLFCPDKLSFWSGDATFKVFLVGFPCEAGHKNLTECRIGVDKAPESFREILSNIKIVYNPSLG